VFWPALILGLVLIVSGRASAISAFKGQETHVLALAAVGGYGFWILRAVALEGTGLSHTRTLFYAAPLAIGLLSVFTSERADRRGVFALLIGFIGAVMLAEAQGSGTLSGSLGAGTALAALGGAGCWALFSLLARPLVREEPVLPVAALVTGIGALCLLVSCISTGESILVGFHKISMAQLRTLVLTGFFTVGLMMVCWLKCLGKVSAAQAGPLWYLGLLFGAMWALAGGWRVSLWWTLGGMVLVILAIRTALADRQRSAATLSDLIRG
jgi:drug/metabolite transporter (DMT)-like permease